MRDLDATFLAAIAAGSVRVTELFTVTPTDGSVYRFTAHDRDLTWDAAGNTYLSNLPISRSPAQLGIDSSADSVQVAIANIIGELSTKIKNNLLDGATLQIKRILWDDTYAANKEIILFNGLISLNYDRRDARFTVTPAEESLAIKFPPHSYQEPCNLTFFDQTPALFCPLIKENFEYSGTATGGTTTTLIDTTRGSTYKVNFDTGDSALPVEKGDTITGQGGAGTGVVVNIVYLTSTTGTIWYVEQAGVQFVDDEVLKNAGAGGDEITLNGTPAADTELYIKGEVTFLTGDNAGQTAGVLSLSGNTTTIFGKLPNAVAAGDTYNLYPGCDYTSATCSNVYNIADEFAGFLHVPQIEETL